MIQYKISIDQDALKDIQDATDWYNEQLPGLGGHFQRLVKAQISSLKSNARLYSVRYDDIRCMLIPRFPFLVHFTISEKKKLVEIFGVLHTSRNPRIWAERKKDF
jgi:plasmid stabilization system protein ParE